MLPMICIYRRFSCKEILENCATALFTQAGALHGVARVKVP